MNIKSISDAVIKATKKNTLKKIIPLKNKDYLKKYPYILIIQSETEKCIKITIYPQKTTNITKLVIQTSLEDKDLFKEIPRILKEYDILHAPGLLKIGDVFIYECYINLKPNSTKAGELLKKLKKFSKQSLLFSIEKIKS